MNHELTKLRKNYSRMSDDRIYRIVENDVLKLTPDGLQALREEVIKRKLPLWFQIDDALEHQKRIDELVEKKCEELRYLPCPKCGSEEYTLNAVTIRTVIGMITVTKFKEEFHFGCYNCIHKLKRKAEDTTSLFGWFSIRGLFETSSALKANDKAMEAMTIAEPTEELRTYAYKQIMAEWHEKQKGKSLTITITKEQEPQ